MEVHILSATANPLETISLAAGCCYGKDDVSRKRLITCMENGHLSVFEHASATWEVWGISRACSHQLVRHRLASYSQKSQRFVKLEAGSKDWYVKPRDIRNTAVFETAMDRAAHAYQFLLDEGVKPEDARFVLPEATKTDICVTMNFRELMHFLDMRMDRAAQWEIRELATRMGRVLSTWSGAWGELMAIYEEISGNKLWKVAEFDGEEN